ncbi:MAG: SMP-30/gluconolactonase/LRE family protein [Candidatus Promineifilaceae bacterium]
MEFNALPLLSTQSHLGEGSLWDERSQRLFWVDIDGELLHIFDPATGENQSHAVGQPVGTVVLCESGGVLLAVRDGFARFDLASGQLDPIADPESHLPDNRFNDGKCDPAGRFWAGTISMSGAPNVAALYRLDADLSVHKLLTSVTVSNGIVWSHDHTTMYYIDTPTREIAAFEYDVTTGQLANRRVAVSVAASYGYPDGMTMDADGNLWVAMWEGHAVRCWDPLTGELLHTIHLPVACVTSCAFGGPDLQTLYITTANAATPASAFAGDLFSIRLSVKGVPAFRFAG